MSTFNTVYDVMAQPDCPPPPERTSGYWVAAGALAVAGLVPVVLALVLTDLDTHWRYALGWVGGMAIVAAMQIPVLETRFANEFERQQREQEWVKTGDYEIVEGEVGSFQSKFLRAAMVRSCCFRVAEREFGGDPDDYPGVTDGSYVRITCHGLDILKLEIRVESNPGARRGSSDGRR